MLGRFTRNGDVGFFSYDAVLQIKRQYRNEQQDDGHCSSSGHIVAADTLLIDLYGHRRKVASDNDRVAEVRQTLNEEQQDDVCQAGSHQRQGYGSEYPVLIGAECLCGFFDRRIDVLQHRGEHQIAGRKKRQHLRKG